MRSSIALSTDDHLLDILGHFENGRFPNTTIEQLLPDNSAHALSSAANWLEAQHADDDADDADDESAAMVKGLRRKALNTTEIKQSVTLEMHQLKARLHAKLGDNEAAIKAYVRALRYEPSNIRCRMELARLHTKLKRYKAAKGRIESCLANQSKLHAGRSTAERNHQCGNQKPQLDGTE